LPGHRLDQGGLEFARNYGRQEARQPGLCGEARLQAGVQETQLWGAIPESASSSGRAKSSKVTRVETGFPGKAKKYFPRTLPKATGPPG
jgi:hypothetical protein